MTSRRRHAAALFPIVDGVLMAGSAVPEVKTARRPERVWTSRMKTSPGFSMHILAWPW